MPEQTPAITPRELYDRIEAGEPVRILDIRDRTAVDQWRIAGDSVTFTFLPRAKVLQAKATGTVEDLVAEIDGEGPITVVCAEGRASAEVADFLTDAGHEAQNLAEGMEGWADLYVGSELESDGARIVQYRRPSSGCLAYLLVSDGEAAVVDPLAAFTDRYVADAAAIDAEIEYVIDTHIHADHVSGLRKLAAETGATAMLSPAARNRGVAFETETLVAGETFSVGTARIKAMAAPGHTTGMTALVVDGVLLSGDSLFVESVARPDLERDDAGATELAHELYTTLRERFESLPDDVLVAPGHYSDAAERAANGTYSARLGELRRRLWAFTTTEEAFVEQILADLPPRPANYERLIAINLGQQEQTEDALELELGPNNCAATA